ncbi:hypothetical protein J6590_027885 [Homalodisca vitripennis]|nr:hypothetical protein J6590_027885 [Homalodisca vitripennis]
MDMEGPPCGVEVAGSIYLDHMDRTTGSSRIGKTTSCAAPRPLSCDAVSVSTLSETPPRLIEPTQCRTASTHNLSRLGQSSSKVHVPTFPRLP